MWLPSAAVASHHVAEVGRDLDRSALLPLGAAARDSKASSGAVAPKRYRMVSSRLYPSHKPDASENHLPCEACQMARLNPSKEDCPASARAGASALDKQPSLEEACGLREEELSLVISLLLEEPDGDAGASAAFTAANLEDSVGSGGGSALTELWSGLEHCSSSLASDVTAAVLLDEHSQEVVMLPSPWHYCGASLPWQCSGRRRRCTAARRLMYWIHALPPLSFTRSQQYAYCEGYAVGGARRGDGVHCWVMLDTSTDSHDDDGGGDRGGAVSSGGGGADEAETSPLKLAQVCEEDVADNAPAMRVLEAAWDLLRRAPRPAEVRGGPSG